MEGQKKKVESALQHFALFWQHSAASQCLAQARMRGARSNGSLAGSGNKQGPLSQGCIALASDNGHLQQQLGLLIACAYAALIGMELGSKGHHLWDLTRCKKASLKARGEIGDRPGAFHH